MKTNLILRERTAQDIDGRIAKILRDLDNPEPPLRLEEVTELLELDKGYYSSSDEGLLHETVHRLKVGSKQVLKRPSLLLDVVKKCSLRALWIPDRKRILIDSELPSPKQRWGEAHEIGHSVIPWHEPVTHGDETHTLSLGCHDHIEAEANYAAGRLLFLRLQFIERLRSSPVDFKRLRALKTEFGNSLTSTLWRAVESFDGPALGLVSVHPRGEDADGEDAVSYFIRSPGFEASFSQVTSGAVFDELRKFCFGKRGPIGSSEVVLVDDNGAEHEFFFECFNNHYQVLTLGTYRQRKAVSVLIPGQS